VSKDDDEEETHTIPFTLADVSAKEFLFFGSSLLGPTSRIFTS
jgi:hypothetical protein